jgi:transposase-like protein
MDTNQTAPGSTEAQPALSEADYQKHLTNLAEKWRGQQETDLALRYQTGVLLNRQFGSPKKRQVRNKGVMKKVSEQLEVVQSELSRMRNFAWQFKSIEDFKAKHATVTSWTEVKDLLPKLTPSRRQQGPRGTTFKAVKESLDRVSSKVQLLQHKLSEPEKKDLLETLKSFAKAAESRLQIHVTIEEQPVESNPVAPSTNEAQETVPVLG